MERYLAEVQPESGVSFHIKFREEENFIIRRTPFAISPLFVIFIIPEAYFSRFVPNRRLERSYNEMQFLQIEASVEHALVDKSLTSPSPLDFSTSSLINRALHASCRHFRWAQVRARANERAAIASRGQKRSWEARTRLCLLLTNHESRR